MSQHSLSLVSLVLLLLLKKKKKRASNSQLALRDRLPFITKTCYATAAHCFATEMHRFCFFLEAHRGMIFVSQIASDMCDVVL